MPSSVIFFSWGFGAFIVYKTVMDAAFYPDISIVAAFILGVITSASVFFGSGFYAARLGIYLARIRLGETPNLFGLMAPVFGVLALLNIVVGKIVVFGFSKEMNDYELGGDVFFEFTDSVGEALVFSFIILIPLTANFASIIYGCRMQERLFRLALAIR